MSSGPLVPGHRVRQSAGGADQDREGLEDAHGEGISVVWWAALSKWQRWVRLEGSA